MRWLLALVGVVLGGALGLFGPVLVMAKLGVGTGSYEDVLPICLATLPLGALGGGALGFFLGR